MKKLLKEKEHLQHGPLIQPPSSLRRCILTPPLHNPAFRYGVQVTLPIGDDGFRAVKGKHQNHS